ncbi:MAG TPA: hypothetical protein VJ761_11050 [Ktedonobacteraceae bacterium]|nr:hypothetical protein [Ktedonobacteraceae bacterium]
MTVPSMPNSNAGDDQEPAANNEYQEQEAAPSEPLPAQEPERPAAVEEEQPAPVSPEAQLPPEARGETNGGPLGCCLGVTIGLFFSVFIGVIGFGHNLAYLLGLVLPFNALTDVRIATGVIALIGAVLCGYFGWKIGRRIYREYEPPVIKERSKKRKARPKPKAKKPNLDPYKNF